MRLGKVALCIRVPANNPHLSANGLLQKHIKTHNTTYLHMYVGRYLIIYFLSTVTFRYT